MNHEFHPEALVEFEDAARYYAERRPGLEQRFITSVQTTIQKIVEHPESHAVFEGGVRRCLTRVFPYAVLYTIEADFILIVAIMHYRQKPGYWRDRVTE